MSEPKEPRENIDPDKWKSFLEDFSARNNNRRARFELFKKGEVSEESGEAFFEEARLEGSGDHRSVVVVRIDRGDANADKIEDTVTNIRGIGVQFDTDGSEDALEITDDQGSLISLMFESRVDGDS
ncbi:MAG: hypothetical protein KDB79_05775 [Acidobacteria bacterium]|nr:hypothetical protein [Acidobacteriota bacterium]